MTIKIYEYRAPAPFVGAFYGLLAAWTAASVFLLGSKNLEVGWPLGQLLMIAFVLGYTWYFSLGISFRMRLDGNGNIRMKSFRRVLNIHVKDISAMEGPRFALIPYGFLRFRLEREKAYLFGLMTDAALQKMLTAMKGANREMKCKGV